MTDATDATPAPPPPPAAATPAPGGGAGTVRNPVVVILLFFVTLGFYGWYWTYQVFKDLKHHTGQGVGGGLALLFAIILSPVIWFLLPSEIGNMYAATGQEKPVRGVTGFWNLIPIVGLIIWVVKVQGAMNDRWRMLGA